MIDEFSWFVGLYEGEGTLKIDKTAITLVISSTDKDVMERSSRFLGTKVREIPRFNSDGTRKPYMPEHYKTKYESSKKGSVRKGKLIELLMKMKPYLSERRQKQLEDKITIAKSKFQRTYLL